MPTISDLVLGMSLDSEGQIKAKVEYDVSFSAAEKAAKVVYAEEAMLYHRRGLLDDWYYRANPNPDTDPSDPVQTVIQVLQNTDSSFLTLDNYVVLFNGNDALDPSDPAPEGPRSFEKTLNHQQRIRLLETGPEHPYVVVSLLPRHIGAAFKIQELTIDVGDPDPS